MYISDSANYALTIHMRKFNNGHTLKLYRDILYTFNDTFGCTYWSVGFTYQGPISWRCLPQNSVLTAPSKVRISMGLSRI